MHINVAVLLVAIVLFPIAVLLLFIRFIRGLGG